MEAKRKIQFAAAAVLINGLIALSAFSPRIAQATSCSPFESCDFCPASLAVCNLYAPAGCTAVSFSCARGLCENFFGICNYQPT